MALGAGRALGVRAAGLVPFTRRPAGHVLPTTQPARTAGFIRQAAHARPAPPAATA